MGIFIKKIRGNAARDLFAKWYTNIISDEEMATHKGQLRKLKEVFPLLENVKQDVFDENLTAVNLQWLDIAWTKYYMKKHINMMTAIDFNTEVQAQVPGIKKYEELSTLYNQAFGSSYTDGNTVMAELFVSNIMDDFIEANERHPEEVNQIILGVSSLFVKTYDIYTKMIERSHLIG
jgi:hypothetical protein